MKKVLIIGSTSQINFGNQRLKKDIISFISEKEAEIVPHTDNYDVLIDYIKGNPGSIILFCPTRIPKNIKRKLSQNLTRTQSMLEESDVIIGYIRLDDYKIQKIVRCFDKTGKVDHSKFPRKHKTSYQNKKHRHLG